MRNRSVVVLFVIGCGGGQSPTSSGVDPTRTLASLDPDEKDDLCRYLVGLEEHPTRMVDCEQFSAIVGVDDVEGTIQACIQTGTTPGCSYTVGQAEACREAIVALTDPEICALAGGQMPLPSECDGQVEGCGVLP